MNEIEKLYENCEIKKKKEYECTDTWEICYHHKEYPNCKGCPFWKLIDINYPPFTAEKQLEIVKMILFSTWWLNLKRLQFSEKFDEGLAQMINNLWQDLTEEEKEQIKELL